MSPSLRLRVLTPADLFFADSLRASVGWNQTLADWERFLALEPDGCFLAEWDGAPAGTATTMVYGAELAWIGMVLVHPEYRRRGIGRALLEKCIERLRNCRVRCIKLDATPDGKKVYDGLGFKDEWTLTRWERVGLHPQQATPGARERSWRAADDQAFERIDTAAFGVSRQRLVPVLARQSRAAFVLESGPGQVAGYGLLRSGAHALYPGPVVAASADTARHLVEALLMRCDRERIYWDIPDQNTAAVEWARQHGFTVQRSLIRMHLGENLAPGDPCQQFALAGPEIG
jgi:ribosomal protein S18 acetylase RimI-like enzyme